MIPQPKFFCGDEVDFVNDYGLRFPGKIVTRVRSWAEWYGGDAPYKHDAFVYDIEPTDAPWMPKGESNLRLVSKAKGEA